MLRFTLALALTLLPTLARAEVPALCADAPNQAEGTLCAKRKLEAAEAELARAVAALDAKLDPLGKHNLGQAQAAWVTFRERECNLETGTDAEHLERNGTIMPMLWGECAVALTVKRVRELADQMKCPGGDLSCEP